ncbi:uncharacterized protein LOC101856087 isoform X2 [Aplysia californica]|nr:uncharacterized protein LOC101856087 isoform X2 [Aplysia californica]
MMVKLSKWRALLPKSSIALLLMLYVKLRLKLLLASTLIVLSFMFLFFTPCGDTCVREANMQLNTFHQIYAVDPNYSRSFLPYLEGIHYTDFTCYQTRNEPYVNQYLEHKHFNCSTRIGSPSVAPKRNQLPNLLASVCSIPPKRRILTTLRTNTTLPETISDETGKACLKQYINQNCQYSNYKVPNIVHYVSFRNSYMDLRMFIALYSVITVQNPCLILLHGDVLPAGPYWEMIAPYATRFVHVVRHPQTHINGKQIEHVQNMADIARLRILLEFGGIYLDTDSVLLQPLDVFRTATFAVSRESTQDTMSNAVMIASPNNTFARVWLGEYASYDGSSWGSHSVVRLTELAGRRPDLVQGMGPIFIRYGYKEVDRLYEKECRLGTDDFGIHLYRKKYPEHADLEYIKRARSTFARISRYVLFGNGVVCPYSSSTR